MSALRSQARDAGRPVSMKCLIADDQGPQAQRAYGGSAVARLKGRERDDGRPRPHVGEPPAEAQALLPCEMAVVAPAAVVPSERDVLIFYSAVSVLHEARGALRRPPDGRAPWTGVE